MGCGRLPPLDLLCIHAFEKQVPPGLIPGEAWWVGMTESSELFVILPPGKWRTCIGNIANNLAVFKQARRFVRKSLCGHSTEHQEGRCPLLNRKYLLYFTLWYEGNERMGIVWNLVSLTSVD